MKKDLNNWTRDHLIRLVNAKYSVPSWILAIESVALAIVILTIALTAPQDAQAFFDVLPLNGVLWSSLLAASGLVAMVGMAREQGRIVRWSSMICFLLWFFGTLAAILSGDSVAIAVLLIPMPLFWAYKYLASYVREFPRL